MKLKNKEALLALQQVLEARERKGLFIRDRETREDEIVLFFSDKRRLRMNDYGKRIKQFDVSPLQVWYYGLGIGGESGEILEKIKKMYRDKRGKITKEFKEDILKESGDLLWYLTRLLDSLGLTLEDCALHNIEKLSDRKKRGKIHGTGDKR